MGDVVLLVDFTVWLCTEGPGMGDVVLVDVFLLD